MIGSAGGSLTDGDFSVNVAAGSSASHQMSLFRCSDDVMDEDGTQLHEVYMITGVSSNLAAMNVAYAATGTNNALCLGHQTLPYDGGEKRWFWRCLPDTNVVRGGGGISVALSDFITSSTDLPSSQTIKFALASFDTPPPVSGTTALSLFNTPEEVTVQVSGRRYAGYTHTGWLNDHFHVYTKDWGSISYSQLETVCGYLEDVYTKLKTIGFPLDTSDSSLFPVEVYVSKGIKEEGYMMSIPGMTPYLVINAKSLISGVPAEINELRATIGHEMMHRVLSRYNNGDEYAFGAMEDGITTWFERIANNNPEHLSSNYKVRTATPLKSLFSTGAQGWWKNWKKVEQQGYAISAFVDYHFSNGNESQIYALAQQVKSGKNIEKALDAVFTTMYGGLLYDTERQYLKFARDYLMVTNCYSSALTPDAIFSADSETDKDPFYKKITIKKASSNLWEEQEIDFTVQDYGCGILQLFVIKPDKIFAPHTKLKVSVPKICNSMDIVMVYKDDKVHTEIVTGQFTTDSDGNNIWSCATELPQNTKYIRLFAMTTMGNAGDISSYTDKHPIKMSYYFEGDFYMPPSESFMSYISTKNASAGKRGYKHHQLFDAIFRIVDPTNIEGFTNFKTYRDTIPFTDTEMGYKINMTYSYANASRRDTGSFQIRLFSDVKVTDPDPFTFLIGGDDVFPPFPWNLDDDPVMAADGSAQLSLLVYHYPKGTVIAIGEAPYLIESRLVSVDELRQSPDGLSGGVLVDVPSQTTDYNCLIVLESIYFDNTTSEENRWVMLNLNILPKE